MLIRFFIWLIFGLLVYSAISAISRALRSTPRSNSHPSRQGEEMVRDPQCGTFIPQSDAIEAVIEGESRFFCSEHCCNQYRKSNQ